MALPIIHATAGYLIQKRDRTLGNGLWPCLLAVLVANLPDFDFLVGFAVGKPGMFHRGFSHTVLAALLFGLVAGSFCRLVVKGNWLRSTILFTSVYLSHLLVDAFTVDARAPQGAQFLWPLTDAYIISPVTIFGEILVDGSARAPFLSSVFNVGVLAPLLRDTAISAAAVAALALLDWARRGRKAAQAARAVAEPDRPSHVGGYELVYVEAKAQAPERSGAGHRRGES